MTTDYLPDREALVQLLAWDVTPSSRDAVPGDSEQERAQYRRRVKRTICRMIEELGDE